MSAATATASRADLAQIARRFPARRVMTIGAVLAAIGAAVFLMGIAGGDPARTWWSYHFNFVFWSAIGQAMVVFAATQKLTKGRWAGLSIRIAESAAAFQVVVLVLFLGLFVGRGHLFPWLGAEPRPDLGWWLTSPVFFVRNFLILAALAWLSWRFVRHDLAPDLKELADGQAAELDGHAQGVLSREAAFLVLGFAFGYSMLGFDLVVSLAHKWVSNLYGAFYFMGSFLGALMILSVLTLTLRKPMGFDGLLSEKQRHDLGKLCFGFSVFWAYLMWSQFLVIWYGNLPEETWFIFYRLWGAWKPIGTAVFLLVFVFPFVLLLGAGPKKHPGMRIAVAAVSLTGIWLERYLEIVPSLNHGAGPAIGLPEIGVTALFAGLFLLSIGWFGSRYPMISPRLAAATLDAEHHH